MKLNPIQAPRKERPLLLLLFLLVAARFVYAAVNPVTGDSVFYSLISEFLAREGRLPSSEVDVLGRILIHPPMIYALSAVFFKAGDLFGAGRFFMKMLFPLAGSLTIILTYLLARELTGNRRTALASALIFAALPLSLYMSTVIYIDMLMALFVTLNIYLLLLALRTNKTSLWAATAITLAIVAVTKQTGVALIAAYFVLSLLLWRKGRDFRKVFLAAVLGAATLLAWNAYYYNISGRVFLPAGTGFSQDSKLISGISHVLSWKQADFMSSEFWIGVPFSYDSIPAFFNTFFGGLSSLMQPIAVIFWVALSVAFAAGVLTGIRKEKGPQGSNATLFVSIFLLFFLATIFAAPLAGTGVEAHARYLLHILPLASIYLAADIMPALDRKRSLYILGALLIITFLAQTGAGIMLTSKRISGWNGCFGMLRENVPPDSIVFYYGFPDWVIYHTGLRAYGWSDKAQPGNYPNDLSRMYQLKTNDFLNYLRSYNVSYLYIDTGQSCGGDAGSFYCSDFAASMQTNPNARRVSTCNNTATGGWGALYAIGKTG